MTIYPKFFTVESEVKTKNPDDQKAIREDNSSFHEQHNALTSNHIKKVF